MIIKQNKRKFIKNYSSKQFINELNKKFYNTIKKSNNIQHNLQKNKGFEENINFNSTSVIKGGAKQFIYISKIGRRKLRYTKKGRKYVLIKKKENISIRFIKIKYHP